MTIEKICGNVEGVGPIDRWKATFKEQSAKNVVDGAKGVLCFYRFVERCRGTTYG